MTGRRRSALPKGITGAEARALLASCDRRRAPGRRDYAVLVTLLRLGLRASEAAALRLEDIDWRAAEVTVHGKGSRDERLPLPADVGEAIAGYLVRGRRPAGTARSSCALSRRPGRSAAAGSRTSSAGRVACGPAADRRAPAAAHRRLPDGRGRRAAARDRPGAAPPSLESTANYAGSASPGCATLALAWPGGEGMSGLAGHVEDYLRLRRALGFKLRFPGQVLPALAAYLEAAGATTVTAELAIAWAGQPAGRAPGRLVAPAGRRPRIRPLPQDHRPGRRDPARRDLAHGSLPARQPVIFADGDIARLIAAARMLNPPLRAANSEAMFGLIAVTGLRLGEAIGLDRADAGLETGLLTIRSTKSGRDRLVPLHPTVTSALAGYARRRDQLRPHPATPGSSSPPSARQSLGSCRPGIRAAHRPPGPAHRGPPAPDS